MTAPVGIFTYNRIDTTSKTIELLEQNLLAQDTDVYVFCDGGKDERTWAEVNALRTYLHSLKPKFKSFQIVEREKNMYVNQNIIGGMQMLLEKYGRVIVVEDDIATSPYFLTYMNEALEHYNDEKRVMSICGFTNLNIPEKGDVYLTKHFAGWGWATWADRWKQFRLLPTKEEALSLLTPQQQNDIQYGGKFRCLHHLDMGKIDWDLSWLIAIRHADGLCLAPTQTLVRNTGIEGGTHYKNMSLFGKYEFDREPIARHLDIKLTNIEADRDVEERLNPEALTDHGFRYNLLGKIVRYVYKKITCSGR